MEKIKDGKVMAQKFFEDYHGKKLGKLMSDFVNSFSFDKKGFLEEIKKSENKNKILNVFLLWLLKLEYLKNKKQYDLRNEASIETGMEIIKLLHDKVVYVSECFTDYEGILDFEDYELEFYCDRENFIKISSIEKEVLFIEFMGREHRTLQQSFSELVFEGLLIFPEIKEKLKVLDEKFYRLPMI